MNNFISYGKQSITEEDINAVINILKSDFLTQGPAVAEFEKAICDYTGAKYCVAVNNGTTALHLAVKALNIPKDSEGITTPITFVASSNCMLYDNIKPVFADINEDTFNISSREIKNKITSKTKLLIPVHFAGRACNMEEIQKIAKQNNLNIIEDAAHAIGSSYKDGTKVGNCKYSDLTTFSFHPVKTITTGEGGVITTNNKELYDRLVLLRTHGITKNNMTKNPGTWYYEQHDLGFNYRLTDFQSALGLSQLKRLVEFKNRRLQIVKQYNEAFKNIDFLKIPNQDNEDNTCFHLYVVRFDFEKLNKTRSQVMDELKAKNIGTQVHYIPVHTQPYYKNTLNYKESDYPIAEKYYDECLSLPLYPAMSDEDVLRVIEAIKKI